MFQYIKIIIFCKRELTAKSRSEIGSVNRPLERDFAVSWSLLQNILIFIFMKMG
jgi:hypothetical protein